MREAKRAKPRYKTTNWAAYNAALKARGSLTIWLEDMQWYHRRSLVETKMHCFNRSESVV